MHTRLGINTTEPEANSIEIINITHQSYESYIIIQFIISDR